MSVMISARSVSVMTEPCTITVTPPSSRRRNEPGSKVEPAVMPGVLNNPLARNKACSSVKLLMLDNVKEFVNVSMCSFNKKLIGCQQEHQHVDLTKYL
jgi:hypothetical protein